MVDNDIALAVNNLYKTVQDRPKVESSAQQSIDNAKEFHKAVRSNFNKFEGMSPDQILNEIKTSKVSASNAISASGNLASTTLTAIRKNVERQERMAADSLTGEASAADLLEATLKAKELVDLMTTLRKEFFTSYDKVISMAV